MYEIFEKLLKEKGVKTSDVCKATGLKAPTFSDWKKGRSNPNADKLILIANYFGVTVEYLKTGKEYEEFSDENALLVAKIRKDTELSKALMKYFELSEEKRKHIVETINVLSNM